MSTFLLTDVSKECQDRCSKLQGDMLKCMNLKSIESNPCQTIIHVECAGYDPSIIPHMTTYYCTDCTTANEELHQALDDSERKAKEATRTPKTVSMEDFESLQAAATKMEYLLKQSMESHKKEVAENDRLQKLIKSQEEAIKKQEKETKRLGDLVASMKKLPGQANVSAPAAAPSRFASTFIDQLNETIQMAESSCKATKASNSKDVSSIA